VTDTIVSPEQLLKESEAPETDAAATDAPAV
jgi:hypothetical protein